MIWLNIAVSVARSPEYIGSEPTQRSTWFSLMAYCAEQENGGVIRDCRFWKDRRWQQTAAVTLEEVNESCDLFWFDGADLHVAFYPVNRQLQVEAGRAGGIKGGRPPKNPSEKPFPEPLQKPSPKPEDKIREEMEEKRECGDTHARGGLDPLVSKIKSLRNAWKAPAILTSKELPIFEANRSVFECFTDDDWDVQREYLAARLPDGHPGWQPRSLIQYLDNPSDVMGHAQGWKAKQRPQAGQAKPAPIQSQQDRSDLEEFLKGGGFLKSKSA